MPANIGSSDSLNRLGVHEDQLGASQPQPPQRAGSSGTRACRAVSLEELKELADQQYFDGTEHLKHFKLLRPDDQRRVAVPSEKVGEFNRALSGLEDSEFKCPLTRPLGSVAFKSVQSLQNMKAIPDDQAYELFRQSGQLRVQRDISSERLNSASPSVASPGDVVPAAGRPASPATHRSGSTGEISAPPRRAPGNRPLMRSSQTNLTGASARPIEHTGARAFHEEEILTGTSAPPTEHTVVNVTGSAHQAGHTQGTNQNDKELPWMARIGKKDWFPQRPLSWYFLGVLGMSAWGAVEYCIQGGISMQDPTKPRRLIAYQMVAVPMGLMPALMFIYLHLNRQRKLGIEAKLEGLIGSDQEVRTKVGLPPRPVAPPSNRPADVALSSAVPGNV